MNYENPYSYASSIKREPEKEKIWIRSGVKFSPCEESSPLLPPGQYSISNSNSLGVHLVKRELNLDDLIDIKDKDTTEIIEGLEHFLKSEQVYKDNGFLWKRGVMLWGIPGGGKTSALNLINKYIVSSGGISIYVDDPVLASAGLDMVRRIQPTTTILVILEDIDSIIYNHGESCVLSLLDGELQIKNVVFIATTNYPEKLDSRLMNRPSRFDIVRQIGIPGEESRRIYLKAKNRRLGDAANIEELELWVKKTDGFTIAHIKELILSVECFGKTLEASIDRLISMMDGEISSDDYAVDKIGPMGFHADI